MSGYRAARRKLAAFLNGLLIATAGAKLVPAKPRTLGYRRLRSVGGRSRMAVRSGSAGAEIELRNGTSDWMTFDQIFIDEDYDFRSLQRYPELMRTYEAIVASGKTPLILDLGANIGLAALYFHFVWPQARIVAVEPDADNVELLRANCSGFDAIQAVQGAAASAPGKLRIKDPAADKNAVQVVAGPSGQGHEVEALTVPMLIDDHGRGCVPFIVKIDIEGGEADLFSTATEWVDRFPLLIVELHDWMYPGQRTARNFLRTVADRDRDFVHIDENVLSIRNPVETG